MNGAFAPLVSGKKITKIVHSDIGMIRKIALCAKGIDLRGVQVAPGPRERRAIIKALMVVPCGCNPPKPLGLWLQILAVDQFSTALAVHLNRFQRDDADPYRPVPEPANPMICLASRKA
jgi:hypothetical protein